MRVFLLEADTLVVRCNHTGRQPRREHSEQVGTMHPIELDLGSQLGGPHRSRIGPVGTEKLGIDPAGSQPEQLVAKAEPAQHANAVRLQSDAGTDLG